MNDVDRIRLEIGDENSDLFEDETLQALLNEDGSVLAAAAHACDILATRFAGDTDVTMDGQSIKRSQRSAMYAARAAAIRDRMPGGSGSLGVVSVSRVD